MSFYNEIKKEEICNEIRLKFNAMKIKNYVLKEPLCIYQKTTEGEFQLIDSDILNFGEYFIFV